MSWEERKLKKNHHIWYIGIGVILLLSGIICIFKGIILNLDSSQKFKSAIWISIGTSLIASFVVYALEFVKEYASDNILKKVNSVVVEGGLDFVHKKRDLDKYDKLIENASNCIDITGYTLNSFYESYNNILKKKIQERGLKVRMLLVDPKSPFAKNREELEGNSEGAFLNNVNRLIKNLNGLDNVEIRLLEAPLSTMIYRIDDVMFIGPHFHKRTSKSVVTYEFNKKGWLFNEYESEFESMWDSSKKVTESLEI
jgi:hypothetical protein